MVLALLCLLLSPVLAFLYHLFPFSFVRRSLSSSSVCLFVLVYFVVRAFDYTLCALLRIRACTCAVSFMLNFVSCLLDSNFIFSFCGCPFFSSSSGMVTTTQGMFSLLPIGRHLCSFAHIRIRATLLRIAASAKLPHVILRIVNQPPRPALTRCRRLITPRFRCLSPRYSWSLVRHTRKLRPPPHHNEGAAPDVLTFEFLDPFAIKLTLLVVRYLQFPFL